MVEVNGILKSNREDCRKIIYKICEVLFIDIKNSKIETPHRIKKEDIIAKFKN